MGKGDKRRPMMVSEAEMAENWSAIFGRPVEITCDKCGCIDSSENPIAQIGETWECLECLDERGYFNE